MPPGNCEQTEKCGSAAADVEMGSDTYAQKD
jgi:hypothetical protein